MIFILNWTCGDIIFMETYTVVAYLPHSEDAYGQNSCSFVKDVLKANNYQPVPADNQAFNSQPGSTL